MKILYLCADPGIPVRGHKGAAIHVRALTAAFSRLGHSVTILTPRAGPADGPGIEAELIEVPVAKAAGDSAAELSENEAIAAAESVYESATRLVADHGCDLVYERYSLWSTAGARLSAEWQLPYLVEFNAPLRKEAARYRTLVNAELAAQTEARILAAATGIVAVSDPLRRYLQEQGVPAGKIRVIANAVDETKFHPAVDGSLVRTSCGLEDKFVVGFVGTARPWHDLETLLDAMARLHSDPSTRPLLRSGGSGAYHLLLVGEFPEAVRAAVASRGLSGMTTIAGPMANSEVPAWVGAMDVAVSPHPPLPDFYFSPLKLFEYEACGTPTIAADLPPIAAVLKAGSHGLLYRPGDAGDLAAQIAVLAGDPARRASMGFRAARHVHEHHTWAENARKIMELAVEGHSDAVPVQPSPGAEPMPVWDEKIGVPLYRATRLDLANAALSKHLPSGKTEGLRISAWRTLKYRPGRRCVLEYEAAGPAGDTTKLIGKVFRDGRGEELFDVQRKLWMNGFAGDASDGISVAEPIAYVPELQMLLQAAVPGRSLEHFVSAPDLDQRARWAAAAIAKLHASGVEVKAAYPLASELTNLDGWAAALSALRPERAGTFRSQLLALRQLADEVPAGQPALIHRDFHYGQILFHERGVSLIDMDLMAMGDPAIDVANFAAHLNFLAIQFNSQARQLARARQVFVDEYLRLRPIPSAAQRIAFYEAATNFRLMHVAATRPELGQYFEPLMEACEPWSQNVKEAL